MTDGWGSVMHQTIRNSNTAWAPYVQSLDHDCSLPYIYTYLSFMERLVGKLQEVESPFYRMQETPVRLVDGRRALHGKLLFLLEVTR